MADIGTSLPVSGTSMPAWTGIGSALITNVVSVSGINLAFTGSVAVTTTPLPVSGINLAGSFAISSSVALTQTGSVAITSSALLPVSGIGIAGGASGTNADFVWHGLRTGSAAAGVPALLLAEVLGSVAISSANFTGSVAITSSALLPVSGQGFAVGASGTNADFVWHGLRTGSAATGAPALLLAEVLGSVALTSSVALTQTGSVAITSSVALVQTGSVALTSSVVLGVSGINLAGSFAISSYNAWAGIGSVLVSNTVNFTPAWEAGSRIYNTSASIAAGGSAVWFYSPAANADIHRVKFSASGRIKAIFGVGSPAQTVSEVAFNSTADPNVGMEVSQQVAASSFVQLVCINNDVASMDLYSTIYATY